VLLRGQAGKGTASSNRDISIVASSVGERVAIVAAPGDAAQKLRELLALEGGRTLGADAAVARAVSHAGAEGDAAVCLRVRSEAGRPSYAVVTAGSNRRVTWAEVGGGKEAFNMLVRAWIAP
jgi:hypothetical protein